MNKVESMRNSSPPKKDCSGAAVETDIGHEIVAETERLLGGGVLDDFQAIEIEARRMALQIMGQAVAHRLHADHSDHEGPHLTCACGGEAHFVGRRPKTFTTARGPARATCPRRSRLTAHP